VAIIHILMALSAGSGTYGPLPAGCLSCEHSFPPLASRFCPQPSPLTFDAFYFILFFGFESTQLVRQSQQERTQMELDAVLMEEATFRVPTFLISGDISPEIWYKDSKIRIQNIGDMGTKLPKVIQVQ